MASVSAKRPRLEEKLCDGAMDLGHKVTSSSSPGHTNNHTDLMDTDTEHTNWNSTGGRCEKPNSSGCVSTLPNSSGCERSRSSDGPKISESLSEYNYLPQGILRMNEKTGPEFAGFDEVLMSFMKEHHIPGFSLVISRHGHIVYTQCYGSATHNVPLRPHHLFRIASVTKILTAVAILRLYDDQKLQLTGKVFGPKGILSQYSPTVSGDRRILRITVRHLLAHSGGWDREVVGDAVFWKHVGQEMNAPEPVSNDVLIRYVMRQKLQFTPGKKYAYSNLGYIVLGRVIEKCSGLSYEAYTQHLLRAIGVTRMQLGRTFRKDAHLDEVEYFPTPPDREVDSIFPGLGKVPAPYGSYSMETGDADGGWIACPTDLIKILHALEGLGEKRLLKPETFKLMLDRPSYARGSCWYGLGLDVSWYRKAWEHGGHIDGATSCLTRNRDGLAWAVLCDYWPADSDYTSLMSFAITKVNSWTKVKTSDVTRADFATLDRKYCVNIQLFEEEFPSLYDLRIGQGYRVSWFDGYKVRNKSYFNIIWVKDGKKGLCRHSVMTEMFSRTFQDAVAGGLVPIHVDSYFSSVKTYDKRGISMYDCDLRFALIFVEGGNSDYILQRDLPYEDLSVRTQTLRDRGYLIQCQSPYCISSQRYVAVLYTKSTLDQSATSWPKPCLPVDKYQAEFDRQTRYGHLPSYLKCYSDHETVNFSAIWSDPGAYLYTAEHDMSRYRVLTDLLLVSQKRFYPLCITGYEEEGGHRFAVVCVKQLLSKK